jgi:hypothetical protein
LQYSNFRRSIQTNDNANVVAQFEFLFDASDKDTNGGLSQGWQGKNHVNNHQKAVEAIAWLQQNHRNTSWAIIAHPERNCPAKADIQSLI